MFWNLSEFSKNQAVVSDNNDLLTYADVKRESDTLAAAVGGRSLVFIVCSNTAGSLLGYIGFLNNNIVPLMVSEKIDPDFFDNLLRSYEPMYIWKPVHFNLTNGGMNAVYSAYGYELVRTGYENHPMNPELALLLTTSGSTGSPKFVRQTYENIKANTESIVEYLHLTQDERAITTLPMNYTYGLSIINTHLAVGAALLLTEAGLMQKEFWELLKRERATSFGGVPYTYQMLDRLRFYWMDLPDLRYMTQAGGKLSPELHKKFAEYAEKAGKKFVVMYGQCEATARMAYLPPEKALSKCGSMGIAIPGGKLILKDVDGSEITEPDKVGELVYSGRNVTPGYAEGFSDLVKGDERGGVLETGDMAKKDSDGYFYVVGRKKRFLKVFGNRVNLDEVDRIVTAGFDGIECATAGTDDHVVIFFTGSADSDEIRKYVSEKTSLNMSAFEARKIDAIPRNDSGKILYTELQRLI